MPRSRISGRCSASNHDRTMTWAGRLSERSGSNKSDPHLEPFLKDPGSDRLGLVCGLTWDAAMEEWLTRLVLPRWKCAHSSTQIAPVPPWRGPVVLHRMEVIVPAAMILVNRMCP
jgi:hypothetical protein